MSYTPPSSDNANLIFSGTYSSPYGNEANLIFGIIELTINRIFSDDSYVYIASTDGLKIYQLATESEYSYIDYSGGFTSVWSDNDNVYVGTSTSGIKYILKTCISGSIVEPYDLDHCLENYTEFNLTSQSIRYIHGNNNYISVCTDTGVDVIKHNPQGYRSYTIISGAKKCFMASDKLYYTISGTEWSINRVDNFVCDWDYPDYSYVTGSGIFESGIKLNDIYITENTGSDGSSNTIYTSTSSGVYVINESDDTYSIYYKE